MAIHPSFPTSPYEMLEPDYRWFSADEALREAIETVIYLYEVVKVKDKFDLICYDASGAVSTGMFDEEWLRLVIKMATGSGKTKVMSLIITCSTSFTKRVPGFPPILPPQKMPHPKMANQ